MRRICPICGDQLTPNGLCDGCNSERRGVMDYVPLTPEESKQQNWGCLAFICFIPTLFSGFFIFMQIHDRNVKDFFKPENFNFFLTIG